VTPMASKIASVTFIYKEVGFSELQFFFLCGKVRIAV
jgi:hypothetical protein